MTALEYLKKNYNFPNNDLGDFIDNCIDKGWVESSTEYDFSGVGATVSDETTTYIFKLDSKLFAAAYTNTKLNQDSICFVEEKEKIVKYYVEINYEKES